LPRLAYKTDRAFLERAQHKKREWDELMTERQTRPDVPMKPQVVAAEVGKRLPDDAIVSADSGTSTVWWARHINARRGQMHSCSGTLASMACALNYAIAAQLAYRHRMCVAFMGDGGFSMLMSELATVVKYKLPIKIVVIKNNTLAQIKWEQIAFLGNPEYGCDLQPIDFVKVAEGFGLSAVRIENPAECGQQVEAALATPGPIVIEAVVDPFEPPVPGHIQFKQMKNFAKAVARGQPDRKELLKTIAEDRIREMI
jgi:pyruvate dehydrogenase (quinone)